MANILKRCDPFLLTTRRLDFGIRQSGAGGVRSHYSALQPTVPKILYFEAAVPGPVLTDCARYSTEGGPLRTNQSMYVYVHGYRLE